MATLALAFPELNKKTEENLEEELSNLPKFTKDIFILFIKLFNNSQPSGHKEEILLCEKFKGFVENKYFIEAVEGNYNFEDLLKGYDLEKSQIIIEECKKIKEQLNILSNATLEFVQNDEDVIKSYLKEWNTNYEQFFRDIEEEQYIKLGKNKELQIKKNIDLLIKKLEDKKSKKNTDFVITLLDDMIDHLNNITEYKEEIYSIAEIDVNNALKDCEVYNNNLSFKTTFIHFPHVDYDNDIKPKGTFQQIYTLLMDYSDSKFILNEIRINEESRSCMNLGKLKKYLKIQEESTFEAMRTQYNIFYKNIIGHTEKIDLIIYDFEECILGNLLLKIYTINKKYLNKNNLIEELNNYCNRGHKDNFRLDLEWASYLSKTRDPYDEIIIPTFTPESIIKLFSLKNDKREIVEGLFFMKLKNKKKLEFHKQVNILLNEEKYTQTLSLTIQSIFEIAMLTIYTDDTNIKNVDDIQFIFNEQFIKKLKNNEEVNFMEIIKKIKEKIQADDEHKKFLDFICNLIKYLLCIEEKDLSYSKNIKQNYEIGIGDETREIINLIQDKNENLEEEKFSIDISKSLIIPEFNITKIIQEKLKSLNMEDTFFIIDSNWKKNIKFEYKRYPSLLYFLFKYPECEKELRYFLCKTDSIKKHNTEKFPTFLLILRIFSNIDNIDLQFKDNNYFGFLIKKEILSNIKSRNYEIFQKSPDVNWIDY